MKVTVVTCVGLGWDCVVGVYKGTEQDARKAYNRDMGKPEDADIHNTYVFHEKTLEV